MCYHSIRKEQRVTKTSYHFSITVSPLNVRLLGAHQPLSAGRRYDLLCQSAGSRPPAVITWWRDGQRLEKTTETVRLCLINKCVVFVIMFYKMSFLRLRTYYNPFSFSPSVPRKRQYHFNLTHSVYYFFQREFFML